MFPKNLPKKPKSKARLRSPAHLDFVRMHPCCVPGCEKMPIDAAHVRSGTGGGMGIKPGDEWVISLCRQHHAEQHRIGEAEFERRYGIDMKALAQDFVSASQAMRKALDNQ